MMSTLLGCRYSEEMSVDTLESIELGPKKVDDPFLKSLWAVLSDDQFKVEDFIDINAKNKHGMTILHFAAMMDDGKLVKQLLQTSANPTVIDDLKRAAKNLAAQFKFYDAIKIDTRPEHYI